MMIRTAIYPRVSTEEQEKEGISFEAQIAKFKRICQETGREVVKVYQGDEDVKNDRSASIKHNTLKFGISGDLFSVAFDLNKRPQFRQMMMDAKAGLFDEIIFFKWDRFSRNSAFQQLAMIYFSSFGVTLTPTDDTTDPFATSVMSIVNEEESKKTSQRIKMSLDRKFEKGIMVSPKMPLGYKWNEAKKLPEIEPKGATIVREIFGLVADGIRPGKICSLKGIPPSRLYSLIRNGAYAGMIRHRGQEKKGIHVPLVSPELFEKANAALASGCSASPS